MKKSLLFSLLLTVFCLSMVSCQSKEDKLKIVAEQATETLCPVKIMPGMEMTSFEVADGDLTMTVEISEGALGEDAIAQLEAQKDAIKASMQNSLLSNPSTKVIADLCKDTDTNIVVKYVGKPSGATCEVEIPASEL